MKVTFLGGAGSVTGSMHLLEVGTSRVLVDCGLFFGRRAEAWEKNRNFPFAPDSLDAVVLSHAHIDHAGNLPGLVKQGFHATIFSTLATRNLCAVMLKDSAHIQLQDAEYVSKKHRQQGLPPVEPLYDLADAQAAMNYFVGLPFHREIAVAGGIRVGFVNAGHILGSALTVFELNDNGRRFRLAYVVDLGRKHLPLLPDPQLIADADVMIMESTYGNRLHGTLEAAEAKLGDAVRRTCARGGKVIIPAFALGRTQDILYCLRRLIGRREIPDVPIYVDSPLAVNVTEVFRIHSELFDEETGKMLAEGVDPFEFDNLTFVRGIADSQRIQTSREPMVIISASGMCETGRILHHLKSAIGDSRNTIVVVSFMAENTLGRRIVEKEKRLKIFGEEYPLNAEVVIINAFSAHADRDELIDYARQAGGRCRKLILVHGEKDQALALADRLRDPGRWEIIVPEKGESLVLE